MKTTKQIAKDIIKFFNKRKGFDDWWDSVDEDIKNDIVDELTELFESQPCVHPFNDTYLLLDNGQLRRKCTKCEKEL